MGLLKGKRSAAEYFVSLPKAERKFALRGLDEDQLEALLYDWRFWARPEQLAPPGDWITWGIVAGRGAGKTRSAGEFWLDEIHEGRSQHPALIGADIEEVRKVMVEGESGVLEISPPHRRPKFEPGNKRLIFPNGVIAQMYGAHDPDSLRGPQTDLFWADEIAKWKNGAAAWDNAVLGNRLGPHPRRVFTTTPKPVKLVRTLMGKDPSQRGLPPDKSIVLAGQMSTYDNLANLAPSFIADVFRKYQGTRIGRQELMGELLMDIPGALWTIDLIEKNRVHPHQAPTLADFVRIVVAIDPAVTATEDSNETGIIVAGKTFNDHYYVWRDESGRHPSYVWAQIAVRLFHGERADRIVAEVNNGGDLVEAQIRIVDPNITVRNVHASRGKRKRAEPVAALMEQGRCHHIGSLDALEDQMIVWTPDSADDDSPDRADAMVWAITELAGFGDAPELPPTSSERTW